MSKKSRIAAANKVIEACATHGHKFFHHDGRISHFRLTWQGRLVFVDGYTQREVSLHPKSAWKGFTEGGTLRALVADLANYIRTGKPIRNHFGPWPDWYCDGDLWAYGLEEMEQVRLKVARTGVLAEPKEVRNA